MPDEDGLLRLLVAIGQRWLADARRDPEELVRLADWLDMASDELRERMAGRRPVIGLAMIGDGWRRCPVCGQRLPWHNDGERGRQRKYCSERCRHRHRKRMVNHVAE